MLLPIFASKFPHPCMHLSLYKPSQEKLRTTASSLSFHLEKEQRHACTEEKAAAVRVNEKNAFLFQEARTS